MASFSDDVVCPKCKMKAKKVCVNKCDILFKATAKFCSECGGALSIECTFCIENICKVCGSARARSCSKFCDVELAPNAKFCTECGSPLSEFRCNKCEGDKKLLSQVALTNEEQNILISTTGELR